MEDGNAYELVDGRLVELNLGFDSQAVVGNFVGEFHLFLKTNPVAVIAPEAGIDVFGLRKLRRPDVSVVLRGRLPRRAALLGHLTIAPDIAIEVVSQHDNAAELEQKVNEYLEAGVRLVWVAYPQTRTITVRRPDGSGLALTPNAKLEGEDVLPGFSVLVADLFPEPEPEPDEDAQP
jgi:Uma2 family endonuclease